MTGDHLLLLNQCFELEKSKVRIKIENFDIEVKPETVERELQTVDSELLGRIDAKIEAVETPIEKIDVHVVAKEPKIKRSEKHVDAIEPEVEKCEIGLLAEEPKIIHEEKEISAVEPAIEKFDRQIIAVEPVIERFEREIVAVEPEIERIDKESVAKEPKVPIAEKAVTASEPVIERVEKASVASEPVIIRLDKGLIIEEPKLLKIEKETITEENVNSKREAFTEITDDIEVSDVEVDNPLLRDMPDDNSDLDGTLSSMSSTEFEINKEGFATLSEKDPKSILTWNVSGLSHTKSKKPVWEAFVQILKQQEPDIVVLQDVKLCSSKILGVSPKLSARSYGGHVTPSYDQEVQDADLVNELQKGIFKKYYLVHSLSSWRVAGQLVFIKKEFKYLKLRFNLSIKTNAKYHHPEGRCIIIQFNSFYLLSLLSPLQGWINRSVKVRNRWDRELAVFLDNSKSEKATIITGNLNCAPEDIDLSDPVKLKQEKSIVLHKQEEVGFPGSRDIDREGYNWILNAGNLKDVYRHRHPYDGTPRRAKNIKFTTLAFLSDKTRCAVRTNLVLMSRNFLGNVKVCEIIGKTEDLDPSGWRHLPQILKLEKKA